MSFWRIGLVRVADPCALTNTVGLAERTRHPQQNLDLHHQPLPHTDLSTDRLVPIV